MSSQLAEASALLRILGAETVTTQTLFHGRSHRANYDVKLASVINKLCIYNEQGSDVFFTVNKTTAEGRDNHHIQAIRAIFVDYDHGIPDDWPLVPSAVVQSSTGKAQCYWVLKEPLVASPENIARWQDVENRWVMATNGDWAARDTARILRLPGFLNNKYNPPQRVKLIEADGWRYDLDDLAQFFKDVKLPEHASLPHSVMWAPTGLPPDSVRERRFRFYLNKVPFPAAGTGKRNAFFYRKACSGVIDFALEPELTATVLAEYSALRHGQDAYQYPELLTLANRAATYGKGVRGSVYARAEADVKVESDL